MNDLLSRIEKEIEAERMRPSQRPIADLLADVRTELTNPDGRPKAYFFDLLRRYMRFVINVEGSDLLVRHGTGPDEGALSENDYAILDYLSGKLDDFPSGVVEANGAKLPDDDFADVGNLGPVEATRNDVEPVRIRWPDPFAAPASPDIEPPKLKPVVSGMTTADLADAFINRLTLCVNADNRDGAYEAALKTQRALISIDVWLDDNLSVSMNLTEEEIEQYDPDTYGVA